MSGSGYSAGYSNGFGGSAVSPPPPPVQQFSLWVAAEGPRFVTIAWTPVRGATAYRVQYRVTGAATWISMQWTTSTTQRVGGLTKGTRYDFRVVTSA